MIFQDLVVYLKMAILLDNMIQKPAFEMHSKVNLSQLDFTKTGDNCLKH